MNHQENQIESVLAEGFQKLDRLAEGQGKIVDIAVSLDQNAELAARAVANLAVITQKQFEELGRGQTRLRNGQKGIMQYLREKLP